VIPTNNTGRVVPRIIKLISVLLAAALVASCSSSSADSDGKDAADSITWGTGTITMFSAAVFAAMGMGTFKDHDLDVTFKTAPAAATLLGTDDAQIIADRSATTPLLIDQGKPTKVLASLASNVPAGLLGSNDVDSLSDLQAMGDKCTIAAATSGIFLAYINYWKDKFGLECKLLTVQDYSLALSGIVAGHYTAAVELLSNAGAALAQKQAHWLIDPTASDYQSSGAALPGSFINTALMTSDSYLKDHKDVLTRFLAAVEEANEKMKTMSNEDIAQAIKDSGASYWSSQTVDQIVAQLTGSGAAPNVFDLDHIGVDPVSEQLWDDSLQNMKAQGVDIDPSDPKFSFSEAVDGSLLSAS
jgi:ABC-type nitrate/sulfonate/bicarbonate transport system substrate-binding protein